MQLRTLTLILGAALVTACGGDDDKNPTGPGNGGGTDVNGSFAAEVSGDFADDFAGEAGFASVNTNDERGFFIALSTPDSVESNVAAIIFVREDHTIPGNGTYTIASDSETATASQFVVTGVFENAQQGYLCGSTGGSVTVTSSAATRVRGSFAMTMDCVDVETFEEIAVEVEGTFDSRGGVTQTNALARLR